MKKQCIDNPNDINWTKFWQKKLENKDNKSKNWDKIAPNFHKSSSQYDYVGALISNLILDKNDTVLDLGCGEGSITLEIAKEVNSVTGIDSSVKMLELLNKRSKEQNIENVHTILDSIENISYEKFGNYDIVIASRCLNGIIPIDKTLKEINKIANKYVFLTVFGPDNWNLEKEFNTYICKTIKSFPDYNYLFNILFNMEIYPNITRLDIKSYREYDNICEIMNNGKFHLENYNLEEKAKLKEYLIKTVKKNPKTEKLYHEKDNFDWILFWWKI